jgi:hypothetical protein
MQQNAPHGFLGGLRGEGEGETGRRRQLIVYDQVLALRADCPKGKLTLMMLPLLSPSVEYGAIEW